MAVAPFTSRPLYRKAGRAVILCALAAGFAQCGLAQAPPKKKPDTKGPRALGLVQLTPNGKAYLIPIVIMLNGEFYDAGAYKAAPVPMALDQGVVYEAEKSGVPQGLFTVRGALQGPNNTWKAEGTWLPEGEKPANAPHKAEDKPRDIDPQDGPPVLHRREAETPKPAEPATPAVTAASPSGSTPASSSPSSSSAPTPAPASGSSAPPAAKPPDSNPPTQASAAPVPPPAPAEKDANIPVLRRGKHEPVPDEPEMPPPAKAGAGATKTAGPTLAKTKPANPAAKVSADAGQMIAAISDAGGPEPRPYVFSTMKPEDEQKLRKQVLTLAATEVQARVRQLAAAMVGGPAPAGAPKKSSAKPTAPQFDDIQFHVFDLSTNNEPVAVLTASARLPQKGLPDTQYLLTLVARQDIYGDLHKAFSNITDSQHLDVLPRMDLIDAVDVDGDGRGELLFRKTSDTGSVFAVYRVIGEQLWPLFDGTPGS